MEENIMQPAESAPQEEAESTVAEGPQTTAENAEVADTTPPPEAEAAAPVTIPIQYNHEARELSLEEAQVLAQKGMKFDELSPTLEKLKFLAAADGKGMSELVDALMESQDKKLYDSIMEECYGDEKLAKRLFEVEKAQRQAKFESVKQAEAAAGQKARDDLAKRLADEFLELKGEFPDIEAFANLPKSVLNTAIHKGISLTDAYLRYQHAEGKKITAAKAAQEQAAKAAVGSQSAGAGETKDPTIDAMLAGIWGRT